LASGTHGTEATQVSAATGSSGTEEEKSASDISGVTPSQEQATQGNTTPNVEVAPPSGKSVTTDPMVIATFATSTEDPVRIPSESTTSTTPSHKVRVTALAEEQASSQRERDSEIANATYLGFREYQSFLYKQAEDSGNPYQPVKSIQEEYFRDVQMYAKYIAYTEQLSLQDLNMERVKASYRKMMKLQDIEETDLTLCCPIVSIETMDLLARRQLQAMNIERSIVHAFEDL
jgi:hypothetical protein